MRVFAIIYKHELPFRGCSWKLFLVVFGPVIRGGELPWQKVLLYFKYPLNLFGYGSPFTGDVVGGEGSEMKNVLSYQDICPANFI